MKRLLLYESTLKRFQIERINKAFFVFLFLLTMQVSFAQNWVGGTSTDFLNGSNWSSSPTFSSATLGIVPVVSPNYNPELLDGSAATTCTVLNIGAGGILTTSANLTTGTSTNTISGTLNVNKGTYTSRVYVGSGGVINVANGATLTGVGVWRLGSASSANESFININGGTFNSTGTSSSGLTLGSSGNGTININNGGVYNFSAGTTTGGLIVGTGTAKGTININSGTLNYTSAIALNINATNGLINIDGGSLVLNGNQTTAIQAFIDANKIKASGAALAAAKPISCKYDIPSNTTIVIAGVFVNYSPVAVGESLTVALNGTATVLDGGKTSVLANDTDIENNPLTAVLVSSPANGTLTLNPNGIFSYVHNGSNTTTDSFSYKANDGNSDSNIVNVTITISHISSPSGLSYKTPNVFTRGVYIAPLNPTVSGGAVASYSVSSSLPAGLSLNTQTGVISGTPRAVSAINNYTITASNLAGSTSTNVTITVNDYPGGGPNTRPMEYLDRGLVALGIKNGVFLSWRMIGTDNPDVGFNLYKNGTKLNSSPITSATNYVDPVGLASDLYKVESILPSGNEMSSEVTVWPYAPSIEPGKPNLARLEIPIPTAPGPGYFPGDMSVGDLDGDGKYELIFEWEPNGSGAEFAYLEAIDLKGKSLWRISYGQNTVYNGVPFMVYDLDGDGKAEVATVTAPGTKDASGNFLSKGPAATDDDSIVIPRASGGHLMVDPSYMTVFNGLTGLEMATVPYPISIGPLETMVATWEDDYGKRAASLKAAVLYDKEKGPLLVFCRGIYSKIGMGAYTWDGNNLKQEWLFDSDKLAEPDKSKYRGEGNHGLTVADVDGDGSDELMYGACAIDNNGNGLYATGRGHGDAHALGDLDPSRPGLEYFQPHENSTYGFSFRDAATGEILWEVLSPADVGRGWAADIREDNPGVELSVVGDYIDNGVDDASSNFDVKGNPLTYGYNSYNQPVYFDGDIQRELRIDTGVDDVNNGGRILTGWYYGASSVHSTKQDANLVADILGDWREEMIFMKGSSTSGFSFVVFSTWIPTEHKVYTLMHDPAYRMQVATQNVGYNQPANLSYYLPNGSPKPDIRIVNPDPLKDTDKDGVIDSTDICPNTPSGQTVNASGCSQGQLDDDNDGVKNSLDICLNTPSGQTVNASGCAQSQLDDDNDGVKNNLDTCPNTPTGQAVNASGCSQSQLDDDNDGVKNSLDLCPNTPAGQTVNASGCAQSQLDDDNDGVKNYLDTCPNTPSGQTVNASGCAQSQLDDDNDGVKNSLDLCPNTPSGQTVNTSGCAQSQLDDDNDGVKNNLDLCPDTPSGTAVNSQGCTLIGTTAIKAYILTPTCPGKANGKISVTSNLNGYLYTITIKGNGVDQSLTNQTINSTTNWERADLAKGTYQVTVAIPSIAFEQSYGVVVNEITDITAKRVETDKTISYIVSGSNKYIVTVNGVSKTYTTASSETSKIEIDANLLQETNSVTIETNSDCQGIVADSFALSPSVLVHPNPTADIVYIENVAKGLIQVYSNGGVLLIEKNAENTKSIDLKGYAAGMYLVKITQGAEVETFKVILK